MTGRTLVWLCCLISTQYEGCTWAPLSLFLTEWLPSVGAGRAGVQKQRGPGFVPALEGCHSWLVRRGDQAESGVRVITQPCSPALRRCCSQTRLIASFPHQEMSCFGLLRSGLGSGAPGLGLDRGLFCHIAGVWFLQVSLWAGWIYWPALVQLLAVTAAQTFPYS